MTLNVLSNSTKSKTLFFKCYNKYFLYKPTTLEILEIQQMGFFDVIGKSQWVVKTQKDFRGVKKLERYVRTGILSDNEKCASYLLLNVACDLIKGVGLKLNSDTTICNSDRVLAVNYNKQNVHRDLTKTCCPRVDEIKIFVSAVY